MTYSVSYLVDLYINKSLSKDHIMFSLIFTIVSIFCIYFLEKLYIESSARASLGAKTILRKEIYSKLLKLGISYSQNISTSNLVQLSVEGVDQLESFFGQYYPQIFFGFMSTMTSFIAISIFSIKTGIALLLCIPLIPISIIIVQKIAKRILGKYWVSYTNLGETFLESLQGLITLKIYQYDEDKEKEMDAQAELFRINTMKVLVMQLNSISIMDMMTYGGVSVGIIFSMNSFYQKQISLGQALFIILLSAEFFLPLRRLGSFFHVAMNGMAASDRIFKFLNQEDPKEKTRVLDGNNLDIVLRDVCFSYDGIKSVLKDVSIDIKEGEFVGIVGESGSGKSTIASLIMGRNSMQDGTLTIGGVDISDINEDSLFNNINYVGLGSVFFKGTVRDNLLLAKDDATDEELMRALSECNIRDFFESEEGLDTQLLENANNLSGGQRQRLALARAILHNDKVYIFDEATSNIDVESEELIMKVIRKLSKELGKTIILISHRLANVVMSDQIYMLEKGQITEFGTHKQLLEREGAYATLYNAQQMLESYAKGGAS